MQGLSCDPAHFPAADFGTLATALVSLRIAEIADTKLTRQGTMKFSNNEAEESSRTFKCTSEAESAVVCHEEVYEEHRKHEEVAARSGTFDTIDQIRSAKIRILNHESSGDSLGKKMHSTLASLLIEDSGCTEKKSTATR